MTRRLAKLLCLGAALAAVPFVSPAATSHAGGRCDVVAGAAESSLKTAQALVDALRPGQVGCLRAGLYAEDVRVRVPRTTLRSFPGERATVRGRMWIDRPAVGATISDLDIDARNANKLPSPTVNAAHVTFTRNDITSHRAGITCLLLGSEPWGRADEARVIANRIHHCGDGPQPTGHGHGLYVAQSRGAEIRDNVIFRNANRGLQLYPNADDALVRGNVFDANGENIIFSGEDGQSSSGNDVVGNLITDARVRWNVEHYWSRTTPGSGNTVRRNCIGGGVRSRQAAGAVLQPAVGWRLAGDNDFRRPRYANAAAGDFTLRRGSPCRDVVCATRAPLSRSRLAALASG